MATGLPLDLLDNLLCSQVRSLSVMREICVEDADAHSSWQVVFPIGKMAILACALINCVGYICSSGTVE